MSRRFLQSCASGYSLVELLIAVTVTLAVTAGALTLALSSRSLYRSDQQRTRLNQSLRAAENFLVADIRQAGERLSPDFPAIELIRGEDLPGGAAGDPDELILRRNLEATVLRVCRDVGATDDNLVIAIEDTPPPGCGPLPIDPGDTFPGNLQRWSDHRVGQGGEVNAYIYNPLTRAGEFFVYDSEYTTGATPSEVFHVRKKSGTPDWTTNCLLAHQCRVYLLEQRRYRMTGDLLQVAVDGDDAQPVNLVDTVQDLQLRAHFKPTPAVPNPPPVETFDGNNWPTLKSVEVTVEGRVELRDRFLERAWTSEIVPRNVL